jgi:AcrR family transcriptional regulator
VADGGKRRTVKGTRGEAMEKTSRMIQSEQTRERIVAAASRLFVRKGFAATSIADLAKAVKVTKGALYHHFESKEAIFYAVIQSIRTAWANAVARQVFQPRDAIGRLEALLDGQARFLQSNEPFCLVLNGLMMEMDGVNPRYLGVLQQVYAEMARFIQQIVKKGQGAGQIRADIDPEITALSIVGMIRGTGCSRPKAERERVDYVTLMGTLKKVVLEGLKP